MRICSRGDGETRPGSPLSPPTASTSSASSSSSSDDAVFLLKLGASSFALGGAIKYGSLLIDLPFQPSATAALALVLSPPLLWAAVALVKSQQQDG